MNPKIDAFFAGAEKWKEEMKALRPIPLACGLTEELKWGHPCYTLEGQNVVLIHGFKEYCALLFMKGVLMKDPKKLLIQQTENVQAGRQIRFTKLEEITGRTAVLKAYVRDAIAVEKSGAKVAYKQHSDYKVPEELQRRLHQDKALQAAFSALTPGRQRGYLFYFGGAKQAQTREARIDKYIAKILRGKGLLDD